MNGNCLCKKAVASIIIIIFCNIAISPVLGISHSLNELEEKESSFVDQEYPLPPPLFIDMPLEKSIMRRMSMRNFTEEPVTDEELSTILWAAYGLREDGKQTVAEINGLMPLLFMFY